MHRTLVLGLIFVIVVMNMSSNEPNMFQSGSTGGGNSPPSIPTATPKAESNQHTTVSIHSGYEPKSTRMGMWTSGHESGEVAQVVHQAMVTSPYARCSASGAATSEGGAHAHSASATLAKQLQLAKRPPPQGFVTCAGCGEPSFDPISWPECMQVGHASCLRGLSMDCIELRALHTLCSTCSHA